MLLQITNSCHMGCRHCLQNSLPEPMHMSDECIKASIEFAKKTKCRVVNISGGEPTEHPKFLEIVKECVKYFQLVTIVSNGSFIFSKEKTAMIKKVLKHPVVTIQITTHKDYYPKYKQICAHRKDFEKLGDKVILTFNPNIYIHQLGRAINDEFCIQKAKEHNFTTSCINAASVFYQLPFNSAINMLECRGYFCKPLVDWKGNIHLSESWTCPNIGNVFSFDKFNEQLHFKPCGGCPDYQKLLTNPNSQYVALRAIMDLK